LKGPRWTAEIVNFVGPVNPPVAVVARQLGGTVVPTVK